MVKELTVGELQGMLATNGFAKRADATLDYVIGQTMQDSQYSRSACIEYDELCLFSRLRPMTMQEIRALNPSTPLSTVMVAVVDVGRARAYPSAPQQSSGRAREFPSAPQQSSTDDVELRP